MQPNPSPSLPPPASQGSRAINFTAQEVLATLSGAKTQVRRIAKFGSVPGDIPNIVVEPYPHEWIAWWTDTSEADTLEFSRKAYKPGSGVRCPYGKPGDVLWVRERWYSKCGEVSEDHRACLKFGASEDELMQHVMSGKPRWRSPLHMPRWACRLKLQITEVRVQRVQDITQADAIAEGTLSHPNWDGNRQGEIAGWSAHTIFRDRWEETYGPDSWAANPWVFAITYSRLEADRE